MAFKQKILKLILQKTKKIDLYIVQIQIED